MAAIAVYAAAMAAVDLRARPWLPDALRVGGIAGVLTGAMWMVSLTVETTPAFSWWQQI